MLGFSITRSTVQGVETIYSLHNLTAHALSALGVWFFHIAIGLSSDSHQGYRKGTGAPSHAHASRIILIIWLYTKQFALQSGRSDQ